MRPFFVTDYAWECWNALSKEAVIDDIKKAYKKLRKEGAPDISVVIPAYNEEKNIIQTLYSLTHNETDKVVEVLVVDNNSKDNTATIIKSLG